MITIVFATSSGSTRLVVEEMSRQLGQSTRLVDLAAFEWTTGWSALVNDLVIAGGPTYGRGDWHHLWESRFAEVAPLLVAARRVALFGLGDSRFHGETFCGGLGRLHDAVASLGVTPAGCTVPGRHFYQGTPSLRGGKFPGLVIDYRLDRRALTAICSNWLDSLLAGHRRVLRVPGHTLSPKDPKEVVHVTSQHDACHVPALADR